MFGRNSARRADRLTLGLAAVAVGTAGTVIGGEMLKLARRRAKAEPAAETVMETAEQAIGAAGLATADTVTVAAEGYEATPRGETVLFNMLNGFLGGFATMRLSTVGIRSGWWPVGNVSVGDRHIHHFVPGILIAFATGGTAIATQNEKLEETLAFPFGVGVGMTFDEAALLLDLRDVYWTREGVLSVQVSLGMAAVLATTILGLRMFRRGERRAVEGGAIPPPVSDWGADPWGSVPAPLAGETGRWSVPPEMRD
ncbi:MAG TPA: hypothetical protein VFY99_01135 [Solirubrobacterales bacterium]